MPTMAAKVLDSVPTAAEEKVSDELVIDVGGGEEVCRICHLTREAGRGLKGSETIRIGCRCKGELGQAHRNCAEAWFRAKGNRFCEICGMNAKNINGKFDSSSFMEQWHEGRTMEVDGTMILHLNENERTHRCWSLPLWNFLLGCLVISFVLPWFLRAKVI